MTASIISGQTNWSMVRDDNGHRTYKITHKVRAGSLDGPHVVMLTPGLPLIGSLWIFDNEFDPWAFCWPNMRVTPVLRNEPNQDWLVEQTFSTKPLSRCQDTSIEDPLLEPQKIWGSSVRFTIPPDRTLFDKDGDPVVSSSHEPLRGLEFDDDNHTVNISQNVASLGLGVIVAMVNTVNDSPLWNFAARKIKLSTLSWERKLYGTCNFYYTRTFGFDTSDITFDKVVRDLGTKVFDEDIAGGDRDNPQHFKVAKDDKGEILGEIPLDGNGDAADSTNAASITVQFYKESNFLLLGIPTTIGL